MQNGRGNTSHRGKTVEVGVDYNWDDGGHPNSVPFYLSSAGYGVFRNTYAPNTYAFTDPVTTTAKEQRFDAYYFAGERQGRHRPVHQAHRQALPAARVRPGDRRRRLLSAQRQPRRAPHPRRPEGRRRLRRERHAQRLDARQRRLRLRLREPRRDRQGSASAACSSACGPRTASTSSPTRSRPASGSPSSTSPGSATGYKFALDGCKDAHEGIEDNSDARGFAWAPRAGPAPSAAASSGPATSPAAGSTSAGRSRPTRAPRMSGLAYTTGDVDGIFGGSPKTYTRDLQWKTFLPVTMTMDGWAANDKQPFRYGEPYTSHQPRLPQAPRGAAAVHLLATPTRRRRPASACARPLVLEYPDDPKAATDAAKYEFLSGEDFLVAPVYQDAVERDGIYLPKGTWIDYWSGRTYEGPVTVDDYSAPLDTLPLFVKAGATVPMWPGHPLVRGPHRRLPARLGHLPAGARPPSRCTRTTASPAQHRERQVRHPARRRRTRPARSRRRDRPDRREQGRVHRQAGHPTVHLQRAHRRRAETVELNGAGCRG